MAHVLDNVSLLKTEEKVGLRRWKELVVLGLVNSGIVGTLIAHIPYCSSYPVKFAVMQMLSEGCLILFKLNAGER